MLGSPRVRKAALVVHFVSSVGWMGTVAAFVVLALAGLLHADPAMAKAAYA